ncbi:MAG: tyrosine--tRNA ligase [Candidatus Obscuribacterales bacterium]|jgi:tyrosyl-tRNA synthetase
MKSILKAPNQVPVLLPSGAMVLPGSETALADLLAKAEKEGRPLRIKLGVDPTSADLHLGHAVVLRALKRFQDAGHQIILLIGGFTATIGDPTGRDVTRPALTSEQVAANAKTYLEQAGKIIDLSRTEVVNNNDWLGAMSAAELVSLTSMVTVNQLLAKDSFGTRIEKQQSVAVHELLYPVLQGFDSVHLRADIEVGGSDQRFNVLMGRQLQALFKQEPQLALLMPLLEGTDGVQKMSKSLGNSIGLRDAPDDMFAKCMRIPDDKIVRWFELATSASASDIAFVVELLSAGTNPKDVKETLAKRIVAEMHGAEAGDNAHASWQAVHCQRLAPAEMPELEVAVATAVVELLVTAELAPSRNQARQLIKGGGVRLDDVKVQDEKLVVTVAAGVSNVLQVGRRKFVRLVNSTNL